MHEIQQKKAEEKNEFIYKLFHPDKHFNFPKMASVHRAR